MARARGELEPAAPAPATDVSVAFLTPSAALLAAGALLPLVAVLVAWRRGARVRARLGLAQPRRRRLAPPLLAVAIAGVLLGLAAAQPVLERTAARRIRTDAEVFVVLDISRSMLARENVNSPTRFVRAKDAALRLRAALPGVPIGLASLTDRLLPHVFPTADEDVFAAALAESIAIERPPPRLSFVTRATSFDALGSLIGRGFFAPTAGRRVAIVLTDGESDPVSVQRLSRRFARPPALRPIFVQFWDGGERVYSRGVPEPEYRPDPSAAAVLEGLAVATGGAVFGEDELGAAAERSRSLLGSGPTRVEGVRRNPLALAPFLAVGALLPIALLLGLRDR